jgi:hypothetical protein
VGAKQAVEDLQRYLLSPELPFLVTLAIAGIKLERRCDLGHSIELLPWNELPASYQKNWIFQHFTLGVGFHNPEAVLIRREILPRLHVLETELEQYTQTIDNSDLDDVLLCAGLVGPIAPYALASWLEPPEWAPVIGGSYSMPHFEGRFASHRQWPANACDQIRTLYDAFLGLDNNRKAIMRLPMQRLNSAMRRRSAVDAAIDLGIVLESLFLRDIADERGELTFRLKVRAARLLGNDLEDRNHLFKVFGDLYSIRSKAVHTGRVPDVVRSTPIRQLLETGFDLASQSIIRFLLEGEPDWNLVTLS